MRSGSGDMKRLFGLEFGVVLLEVGSCKPMRQSFSRKRGKLPNNDGTTRSAGAQRGKAVGAVSGPASVNDVIIPQ